MNRFFIIVSFLVLLLVSASVWATPQKQHSGSKVALEIYFYDDIAIDKKSEDLFESIFAKLRPDLVYRRISIKARRSGKNRQAVVAQLKQQMATALAPDERLAFLLIDTHGNTEESNLGGKVTSLGYVGKIYETGVDPDFDEVFSGLKAQADPQLQIILNSCSTFCGGSQSAARRGKRMLDYFGARDGGIYGSNVMEISQALDHPEFFKWKYIIPTIKTFLGVTVTIAAITLPAQTYVTASELQSQVSGSSFFEMLPLAIKHAFWMAPTLGVAAGSAVSVIKPFYQFLQSRFLANRGYYFSLKNGKLDLAARVVKYREIKNLILQKTAHLRCQSFLTEVGLDGK